MVEQDSPAKIILTAAFYELPFILGGMFMFLKTENMMWAIGGFVIASLITLSAVLKIVKQKGQG